MPDGPSARLLFAEQSAFFDGADGSALREQGWKALLDSLATELQRS